MKKFIYILTITFLGCNSEQAPDCFQTSGKIERIELSVDDFSRILVKQNVELIIKQEPFFKVEIEGGKNLLNEVKAEVEGRIVKVMVEDASPVEYGQVLFLVEPA